MYIARLSYAVKHAFYKKAIDADALRKFESVKLPSFREQQRLLAVQIRAASTEEWPASFNYPDLLAGEIGAVDAEGVLVVAREMAIAGLIRMRVGKANAGPPGSFAAMLDVNAGGLVAKLTPEGEKLSESRPEKTERDKDASAPTRRAVILSAIGEKSGTILRHLKRTGEETVGGTVFMCGRFKNWEAAIAEIGIENSRVAAVGERAFGYFKPGVALFVGIAGEVKDVAIGDVVVATKVYAYEAGKDVSNEFRPRPEVYNSAHELEQRARAVRLKQLWRRRLAYSNNQRIFVGAIAAGEKVVASRGGTVARFLRKHYSDVLAVDMEGRGFLEAVHINPDVKGCVIRGISDLRGGKSEADAAGSQARAADAASAVAFEILATLPKRKNFPKLQ